jgi:hypothetical protein
MDKINNSDIKSPPDSSGGLFSQGMISISLYFFFTRAGQRPWRFSRRSA